MADDLAAMGVKNSYQTEEKPHFEVWQENAEPVRFFLLMSTQWRAGGMGGPTGMDYAALFQLFSFYDIKKEDQTRIFESVRTMEMAVLEEKAKGEK